MLTVSELLSRRSCSDRPAIAEGATCEGVAWWEVADQAARWRDSAISGPVGLALSDPVAQAANFVAALAAGVTVAPLDPGGTCSELAGRIRVLGLRSLVISPGMMGPEGLECWVAGRRELQRLGGAPARGRPLPAEPSAVAAIMASSGTTGDPKIIPLTETQLLTTAEGVAQHLSLDASERGYSPLPLFHINGLVVGVLSSLVAGSSIVVERGFSRRAFWPTVERCGATWVNLVPAILAILGADDSLAPEPGPAPRVRLARSASAPLPQSVRDRFEALTGIPVVETYGMTEAASQITANPVEAVRSGSVGLPVGIEVRVVGPDGRPLAAGHPGLIQIRGDRVTKVYWSPEGTDFSCWSPLDDSGWLSTGDLGQIDQDGYVYLVGREGDVINRGGEKIQPREVEEVLLEDPRVAAAVLVGRPHPTLGEEPVAYVLAHPEAAAECTTLAADLAHRCTSSLSRFKRPAVIHVADRLPAGPTGKVKRADVRAMARCTPPPVERA